MGDTSIEWTDATWNPVRGCSRVSAGCEHCYAERVATRFSGPGQPYEGLVRLRTPRSGAAPTHGGTGAVRTGIRGVWNGVVRLVPDMLDAPLHWRKPRRVFVNSMSDLFHESLTNEQIAAVFGVMAACPQHTFQVLTKRARRMREWFGWIAAEGDGYGPPPTFVAETCAENYGAEIDRLEPPWPLPNVHLGVSCEDQETWDARTAELRRCPAAIRWVSLEPQLGDVGVEPALTCSACGFNGSDLAEGRRHREDCTGLPPLDWIVVGGESGPGARPFDLTWARSVIAQCRAANTACFVKQLGSQPQQSGDDARRFGSLAALRDRKGGTMDEWPADLRVRMWPGEAWT